MSSFWRKPGKTLISLMALFMTVGLLGTRVYALDNDTQDPGAGEQQEETDPIKPAHITPLLQLDAPDDLKEYLDIEDNKENLVIDMFEVATFYKYKFTPTDTFDLGEHDLNKEFILKITGEGEAETDNSAEMIAKWDELAQELAGQVKDGEETGSPHKAVIGVKSEDLEPGLYLILAYGKDLTGADRFEEIEMESAEEGEEPEKLLTTVLNTELFTYNFRPVLIVVPSKSEDANQKTSDEEKKMATSDEGDWIHDVKVYLKPSQKPRLGNLRIFKEVDPLEQRGEKITPMTAVFRITGWEYDPKTETKGEEIYHNVASITVPSADSVLLEGIPAGTYVEVEEIYDGSGYKFLEKNPTHVIIKAAEPAEEGEEPQAVSFTFKNTYDNELKKGYGVQNSFNKEDGKWTWTNDLPASPKASQGGDER